MNYQINYSYISKVDHGTLKICGYLRGKTLNINNLVYLPTIGTFQIQKIDILKTQLITKVFK